MSTCWAIWTVHTSPGCWGNLRLYTFLKDKFFSPIWNNKLIQFKNQHNIIALKNEISIQNSTTNNKTQNKQISGRGIVLLLRFIENGIRLNCDWIPTFGPFVIQVPFLTPVRYVHYPEEQAPLPPIFLSRLSRVDTSCQFMYDFMELKGTAIKYLGVRWTKADTEPYAEIIGSGLYQSSAK